VPATDGAVPQHVADEKLTVPLTVKVGSKRAKLQPPVEGPALKKLKKDMDQITKTGEEEMLFSKKTSYETQRKRLYRLERAY
jgi:hypothetical protein